VGAAKLRRIWIRLPDVPPELFKQARHDDGPAVVLARQRALFSYFGASTKTKEEAEKLVFALAAAMFPAFRPRSEKPPKRPGRRPAQRPKYEVELLRQVAEAYENTKSTRTAPISRYVKFLKENPILANRIQVGGEPLRLGSFNKLLVVGRLARKQKVIWHKDFPLSPKRSGYVAVNSRTLAAVYNKFCFSKIILFCSDSVERSLFAINNPAIAAVYRKFSCSALVEPPPWFDPNFVNAHR
jgi:hypothetical protein